MAIISNGTSDFVTLSAVPSSAAFESSLLPFDEIAEYDAAAMPYGRVSSRNLASVTSSVRLAIKTATSWGVWYAFPCQVLTLSHER